MTTSQSRRGDHRSTEPVVDTRSALADHRPREAVVVRSTASNSAVG